MFGHTLEDDLIFFWQMKMTYIFRQMEENLFFWHMKMTPNVYANGRLTQVLGKWKTTSVFREMDDYLNL